MYEFLYYRVRDAMTPNPVTISPSTPLSEVEALFERQQFNALPVVDDTMHLLAIVTKLDILKAFSFTPASIVPHYHEIMQRPINEVMTSNPIVVDPEWPLTRVLERLIQTRNKSFPVVHDGHVVGIIAREDVMRALRRADAGQRPD